MGQVDEENGREEVGTMLYSLHVRGLAGYKMKSLACRIQFMPSAAMRFIAGR